MKQHPHQTPLDELTGRWRVEAAEPGAPTGKGRVWLLTLRHIQTDTVEQLRCWALARTTYRAGQEIDGHVEHTFDGPMFRRDYPAVGPGRTQD